MSKVIIARIICRLITVCSLNTSDESCFLSWLYVLDGSTGNVMSRVGWDLLEGILENVSDCCERS